MEFKRRSGLNRYNQKIKTFGALDTESRRNQNEPSSTNQFPKGSRYKQI